jgi:hypothetical protein
VTVSRAGAWSRRRTRLLLAGCLASVAIAGCGKKGAPLAPFVRLPAVVQRVTAARHGRDVYVTLTIPAVNVDRSTPVDLGYVDVYAYTGATAPPRLTFLAQATRIARVPVAPAPLAAAPTPAPDADAAPVGATITIVDSVAEPVDINARRFYLAIPFSTRGRPGPQHTPVELRFAPLPPTPAGIRVQYTERAIAVTWAPSQALPGAAPPRVNVYRELRQAAPLEAPLWLGALPAPLNAAPLSEPPFTEAVTFGVETCYVLRGVVGEGQAASEGESSPSTCVTPVDGFAPAAPAQLVAVATAGAINLLWEPNAEPDLAGYLVLRGTAGDARLQPLTPEPTSDARFVDRTVVAGVRYVYAVVALDRRTPTPNVSPESARVEEVAQ